MKLIDQLHEVLHIPPAKKQKAPAVASNAEEHAAPPENRRKRPRINARQGVRVLIIDDSPRFLTYLVKLFRSAGYVPLLAGSAERGLRMARSEHPDLVMLDVILPGMSGFAALRHLRRDPEVSQVPVIMMSRNQQATEQIYVKRIGADDIMKKPFSRFDLFNRIEQMLDENRVPRRNPT
jgi:twitching motility two-component system response regulator PilH